MSDPTDCLTEAEERAMEEARQADLEHDWQVTMDEAFEALIDDLGKLDASLAKMAAEHAAGTVGGTAIELARVA